MPFKEIVGQDRIKQSLIQTVKNARISHAQLFLGPEGAGTLPLAVAYAQFINCLQPSEDDSCGVCASCIKYQKLVHPDLHFTFPTISVEKKKLSNEFIEQWREAFIENPYINELQWLMKLDGEAKKQGNITADECRDVIRKIGLKAFEAKYKTVIIWMPEYMGYEGNILLKLLEEPPEKTLIILVAKDADKMLGTILSRTQLVKIPRLRDEEIAQVLIEKFGMSANDAEPIARVSEGNLTLATELAEAGRSDYHELFVEWMRACYKRELGEINALIDKIISTGREFIKSFIAYSQHMLRAVLLSKHANPSMIKLSSQEQAFLQKFSIVFNDENIEIISRELNQTFYALERNADLRIIFLNLSLYISRRLVRVSA